MKDFEVIVIEKANGSGLNKKELAFINEYLPDEVRFYKIPSDSTNSSIFVFMDYNLANKLYFEYNSINDEIINMIKNEGSKNISKRIKIDENDISIFIYRF